MLISRTPRFPSYHAELEHNPDAVASGRLDRHREYYRDLVVAWEIAQEFAGRRIAITGDRPSIRAELNGLYIYAAARSLHLPCTRRAVREHGGFIARARELRRAALARSRGRGPWAYLRVRIAPWGEVLAYVVELPQQWRVEQMRCGRRPWTHAGAYPHAPELLMLTEGDDPAALRLQMPTVHPMPWEPTA